MRRFAYSEGKNMNKTGIILELTADMVDAMTRNGKKPSASAIKATVCRWHTMIDDGEVELSKTFKPHELARVLSVVIEMVRLDRLNHEEFWGLSAQRVGEIVCLQHEELGGRCMELSELAILALKQRVSEVVMLPTGRGGRMKRA